jgi:PAS domain S-box-containing protein
MSEVKVDGSRENLYISPNVESLTGYPRSRFDEDWHFWPTQVIHPEDQTAAAAHANRLAAGQAGEIEYRLLTADGRTIWVRDSGRSERIGDKVIIFGVVSDITDRKQAEAEREQALAEQAASARENARLFEAARQATARLAEAEESERQQLARELHDRVGQNLTALSLNLTTMSTYLAAQSPSADPVEVTGQLRLRLEDSKELVKETTQRIRSVMDELRSPVLEEYGLAAALRWYGKQFGQRSGLAVVVEGETLQPRPSATVENTFFRIAQEALTNTAKHAQAGQVTITLAAEEGRLRMVIADNGRGFSRSEHEISPGERRRGLGLLTIAERAEAVGGRCLVESAPGAGVRVIVEVEL